MTQRLRYALQRPHQHIMDVFNVVIIAVFMFTIQCGSLPGDYGRPAILLTILLIIKPAQRRAWQSFSNKSSNFNAYIHENISGIKVTQIFVREELNKTIFSKHLSVQPGAVQSGGYLQPGVGYGGKRLYHCAGLSLLLWCAGIKAHGILWYFDLHVLLFFPFLAAYQQHCSTL